MRNLPVVPLALAAAVVLAGVLPGVLPATPIAGDATPPVDLPRAAPVPPLPPAPDVPPPAGVPLAPAPEAPAAVDARARRTPAEVKAIYLTSWSAATPGRLAGAVALIDRSELNAVVIDIKDYTGTVVFPTANPLVAAVGSSIHRLDLAALVRRLHERGIYVIVRLAVFQDQHLVRVRPHLAVRDASGGVWRDRKGLGWVDPAAEEVWRYVAAVAREAARAGVDEVNFDYIRFPSDGRLSTIRYPVFDARRETRQQVLQRFFTYLTAELGGAGPVLSADLFGLATVREDDLGIGQVLEDALLAFDVVAPMVYPSHYARGFLGYANPAAHPYEVVAYSLTRAAQRQRRLAAALAAFCGATEEERPPCTVARIRPWLQAFDLGAPYPPHAVRAQVQAVADAGLRAGWLVWNPSNRYRPASFHNE